MGEVKVKLYIDLMEYGPYLKVEDVFATGSPMRKVEGYSRYRVEIDLPDMYFIKDLDVDADADIEEGAKKVSR